MALVVGLGGVAAGCRDDKPAAPAAHAEPKPEGVDVVLSPEAAAVAALKVEKARAVRRRTTVTAVGSLDFPPSRVARVGPSTEGRVSALKVEPGQRVSKGATLAVIESADAGRSRADLLVARTRLEAAELELAREKRLLEARATSEKMLHAAETEVALAKVGVRASEERLRAIGASGGGATSVGLTAPIGGLLLEVSARIGQVVGPHDTLFVVGEPDVLWLMVDIYERDLSKVRPGDTARVAVVAYPGRVFEGRLEHVGSIVDPERKAIEARIVLQNADGALRSGMTATAQIVDEASDAQNEPKNEPRNRTAVAVPRGAITTIDGQTYVFVEREAGKYELRAVERGDEIEGLIEARRGLKEGEPVVIDGAFVLKSELLREQMGKND